MILRGMADRESPRTAEITGCPAPQTSLRSLRKLDCVAGHDAGECDTPRLNLRLIRPHCHCRPVGEDERRPERDAGSGIMPAHDRGHVVAGDEQARYALARS